MVRKPKKLHRFTKAQLWDILNYKWDYNPRVLLKYTDNRSCDGPLKKKKGFSKVQHFRDQAWRYYPESMQAEGEQCAIKICQENLIKVVLFGRKRRLTGPEGVKYCIPGYFTKYPKRRVIYLSDLIIYEYTPGRAFDATNFLAFWEYAERKR